MHRSQTRETAFNKDEEKHGQREMLEGRDIRQVPNKRRVEVQSQNRDFLIRDVCTCLARGAPGRGGGGRGRGRKKKKNGKEPLTPIRNCGGYGKKRYRDDGVRLAACHRRCHRHSHRQGHRHCHHHIEMKRSRYRAFTAKVC